MISASVLAAVLTLAPTPVDGDGPEHIGFAPSEYRGKWYSQKHESVRECIMWRESRHNYRAANKSSSARGAYQFLDSQWRRSLTFMLMSEHSDKKEEVKSLRDKPIHHWSRYWQDAAFWVAWRHGEGRHHWSLQGNQCW